MLESKGYTVLAFCGLGDYKGTSGKKKIFPKGETSPPAEGLAKLKSLEGEWMDVDGVFGEKGKVAVSRG